MDEIRLNNDCIYFKDDIHEMNTNSIAYRLARRVYYSTLANYGVDNLTEYIE